LGEPATVTMHRQIMDFPKDIMIDHINGNGIDNRRSNLRFATYSQNLANMRSVAPSTSRFKGVYWDKKANAWGSTIQHEKERIFIGYFNDEYAAALAYDAHARELFKEYAYYDDPDNYIGTLDFPGAENAYEAVDVSNAIFPHDWTHINYAQYLPKTDTFMVSLRSFDLIAEINRSGEIIWSFGPGVIKHQHYPKVLDDGTVLIYDNGNGRVIRITRDQKIIWEYSEIYAPFLGDNDLLPDGNYKIVQTTAFEATGNASDLRIVNPDKETLWKLSFPGNHVYRVDLREK
ncbi:hypothetical protein LCGC14_0429290, partial [marine sediment metagenome]